MLECLKLTNVGPAPEMTLELAPRFNLFTGDNGLGKSFLLDVAWWALTRSWPQEVNPGMTSGLPAQPGEPAEVATIHFRSTTVAGPKQPTPEPTRHGNGPLAGREPRLVVYAHADGSFSVWDPIRNYSERSSGMDAEHWRPAYVFTEAEVWDGIWHQGPTRRVPLCNGLLYDWAQLDHREGRSGRSHGGSLAGPCAYPGRSVRPRPPRAALPSRCPRHPLHRDAPCPFRSRPTCVGWRSPCRSAGLHAHLGAQ